MQIARVNGRRARYSFLNHPMLRDGSNCARDYMGCFREYDFWIALDLVGAHPLQHLIDVRDRRFRLDAVPEVEYEPALAEVRQHVIDRLIESGAACDQRKRVQISLHRDPVLYVVADQRRFGCPIDADRIDASRFHISGQQRPGPPWKPDDLRTRCYFPNAL